MLGCVLLRVQSLAEKPKYTAESNSSHSHCLEHHQQAVVSQAQTPQTTFCQKSKPTQCKVNQCKMYMQLPMLTADG